MALELDSAQTLDALPFLALPFLALPFLALHESAPALNPAVHGRDRHAVCGGNVRRRPSAGARHAVEQRQGEQIKELVMLPSSRAGKLQIETVILDRRGSEESG